MAVRGFLIEMSGSMELSCLFHLFSKNKAQLHQKDVAQQELCVSLDMQKVTMLPRMKMHKTAFFTCSVYQFNETFAVAGKQKCQEKK